MPTEPEPGWAGRAGFPHWRHSTLLQPLQAHGAGKVHGDTSRPAAFPREFINPSRHLGWTGDFPVQGLVLLILHCFFCLNYPLQEPKTGGFPLGPCGLAEFLDDPRGFVSVPVLGSGSANRAHSRSEPRNRGSFRGQALHYPTLTWHNPAASTQAPPSKEFSWLFPAVGCGCWVHPAQPR